MSVLKQAVLGMVVVAAALALWIAYVPSAAVWLDRAGLLDALGLDAAEAQGEGGGFGGGSPAQVVVAEVAAGVLNDRITAIGDGRALRSVTVRSDATGVIEAVEVDAGGHLEEGDAVVRLNDGAERIAVERARLMLEDAQEDAGRLSQLGSTGSVTAVTIREAELALRTAELGLRQAEFDLAQRVVRAPISGWVGLLEVEEGDRVTAQDALATITDRSAILIDFRLPERVIGQLEVGMPLEATPLALSDTVLRGEIAAIDNIVDRASRTLRVQGRLDNAGDQLRAGMAFAVELSFPGETFASVDPLALQWSGEGPYVWAVQDGKAARVPVLIRQRNSDSVLVEAELQPGDLVVTEGVQTLRPGAEVVVADDASARAATGADPSRKL